MMPIIIFFSSDLREELKQDDVVEVISVKQEEIIENITEEIMKNE